ncbi:hypothetical protein QTG87_09850 [Clostridium perfringens]|nr:hypothetical protein [Clostridium perfringens]
MKILFVDPLSPKGHKNFNLSFIRVLKKIGFVEFICKEGYMNDELSLKYIPKHFYKSNTKFKGVLDNLKILNWIIKNIDFEMYDAIIFSSFDTISFSIVSDFFKKYNICIVNHKNVDELDSKIKQFFYKRINKNIKHIYLEDFITEYVRKKINICNIFTVYHPLKEIDESKYRVEENFIFSPGGQNEKKFIDDAIISERKNNTLENLNLKLYIKSQKYSYDNRFLIINNNYLEDCEYNNMFRNAKYILIYYDKSFRYRISAVFLEAIAYRKNIICSKNLLFNSMFEINPNLGYQIDDYNNFINNIKEYNKKDNLYKNYGNILSRYSDENIKKQLLKCLQE